MLAIILGILKFIGLLILGIIEMCIRDRYMEAYDYILVNDELDLCVEEMHRLIQAQHQKTSQNLEFIAEMKTGLSRLSL